MAVAVNWKTLEISISVISVESSESGSSFHWIEAVAECKEREERKAALDDVVPDSPQLTLAPIHIESDDCAMAASCAHVAPSSSALETSSCAAPSPTTAEAVARSLGTAVDADAAVFSCQVDSALAASQQSQLAQCQTPTQSEAASAAEPAAARPLQHWGCATAAQLHCTSVQPPHALAAESRTPHRASAHGASLQRALQLLRHNQERRELDTLWQLASMAAASVLRSA